MKIAHPNCWNVLYDSNMQGLSMNRSDVCFCSHNMAPSFNLEHRNLKIIYMANVRTLVGFNIMSWTTRDRRFSFSCLTSIFLQSASTMNGSRQNSSDFQTFYFLSTELYYECHPIASCWLMYCKCTLSHHSRVH